MLNARRAVLVLVLAVTAASCSRGRKSDSAPVPSGPVSLHVENHNYLNVVVYVVHDGQRTRLGTATGLKSTDFAIPYWVVGQVSTIRLLGDPVGSNDGVVSEAVTVRPWMRLDWTLETDLSRSALSIR